MQETDLTRENYHATTSSNGKPLMSSSALPYAYSGQGGSIQRLDAYLTAQESAEPEEEKVHQELGSLLHSYLEDHTKFALEPGDKPDKWVCDVIDAALASVPGGQHVNRMEDLKPLLFSAARDIGAQPRWGEEAIIKNVANEKGAGYFHFLKENTGKKMITASQREKLEGMQAGIANSRWAEVLLAYKHPEKKLEITIHREIPVLWDYKGVPCKSLLDRCMVSPKTKTVFVNDFKTTSSPVGIFDHRITIQLNENGHPTHVKYPGPLYSYRYYRQTSFYELAMRYWISKLMPKEDLREWNFHQGIFVVCSNPPHEVRFVEVIPQARFLGKKEIDEAFDEVVVPHYAQKGYLGWK